MKSVTLVLAALLAPGLGAVAGAPMPPLAAAAPEKAAAETASTRVYYFHGNARCRTCLTIEAWARETVTTAFAADLQARRLEWLTVNVDQPENRHFVEDYRLYTRSVVVVDASNPKRYKVLERVWELVRDKRAFQRYVEQEVRGFGRS